MTRTGSASAGYYAGLDLAWAYDNFGNRESQTPSGTSGVSLTQPGPLTFTAGNNRAAQFSYDSAGHVQTDFSNSYLYDAEGRICAVNSTVQGVTLYLYDAEGRRVGRGSGSFSCNPSSNGFALTHRYVLDLSGAQVTELDGSGNWLHTNAFANGTLLATYSASGTPLSFALNDWVGTKRVQAKADGERDTTFLSLPFGDQLTTGTGSTEQFYTGKERDAESGLDYFGARYYGSSMGRFMSPDPVGPWAADVTDPQSWNFYNYARNNPLINIDPTGLDCVHINNDTGAYEGFESGDCDNSTTEKANSGYYVDGTVSNISLNGQGQVTGYDANTSSGMFDSYAGSLNPSAAAANLNPYTNALSAPGQSVTVNGNPMPGLDPSLDLLSNVMFSKAIQHNNPNPGKGAQPVRGKDGKITGWTLPGKGNKSGQRVPKTLQWGRENGLNPDDPRWTKMAVGVGAAAAGGLTVMQILEYGAAGALVF